MFDQAPNVACIASASIMADAPVLIVTHYEDDHSWAFLDGKTFDPATALLVAMSEVLDIHPELSEVADLSPGWTATRGAVDERWVKRQDD